MFFVPVVVIEPSGVMTFHDGSLARLAPDLAGTTKIQSYARLSRPGWHSIDFGYSAYVQPGEEGAASFFPGCILATLR